MDTLAKFFPGTPEETLKRVIHLLDQTIAELLTDALCVRWGEESQKRFGELTTDSLTLTGSVVIQNGQRHLSRMYAILEQLSELLKPARPEGLFSFSKHESPWKYFQRNEAELRQIEAFLKQALPEIVETTTKFTSLRVEFSELESDLDVSSLAARYIADNVLDKTKSASIAALLSRSLSLTQTVAFIKQGNLLREQAESNQRQLVLKIQDGVLNALPSWIETVTTLFQKQSQTPTELYTLREGLDGLLSQLKL